MTAAPPRGSETVVIVTADDLGWERSVSLAILDSLIDGTTTHASLIANLDGFDDACALVHERGLAGRIGIHVNLTDGRPLTDEVAASPRFCRDGVFRFPRRYAWMTPLSSGDRRAVAREVRAQIAAVRARGIPLSHLDSHHHIHTEPHLASLFGAIARESGIVRVRPARNCGQVHSLYRRVKNRLYNGWLGRWGLRRVQYFGGVDDIEWLRASPRGLAVEIMVHPTFDAGGAIVDGPSGVLLADWNRKLRARAAAAH